MNETYRSIYVLVYFVVYKTGKVEEVGPMSLGMNFLGGWRVLKSISIRMTEVVQAYISIYINIVMLSGTCS